MARSCGRSCVAQEERNGRISQTILSPPRQAIGSIPCSPARRRSPSSGPTNWPMRCTVCCRGICAGGSTSRLLLASLRRPARRFRSTMRPRTGRKLSIRVQEMFGLDRHPAIAGGRVPLLVELLSPAHRPVQVTRDLPGFWRGSYGAVKAEMKGRYPRHPWPEDPLAAVATRRAKPRPLVAITSGTAGGRLHFSPRAAWAMCPGRSTFPR